MQLTPLIGSLPDSVWHSMLFDEYIENSEYEIYTTSYPFYLEEQFEQVLSFLMTHKIMYDTN